MKSTTKRIKLDWSKLVGFNQVKSFQAGVDKSRARAAIGVKAGAKVGGKPPPVAP
jgi:hypothetical protein